MPEQITKPCPLCGLLAVRIMGSPPESGGWGTKWICYNKVHPRWQETGPVVMHPAVDRGNKRMWAVLNSLPGVYGAPAVIDADRVAALRAARTAQLEGTGNRDDVDYAMEHLVADCGVRGGQPVPWQRGVTAERAALLTRIGMTEAEADLLS